MSCAQKVIEDLKQRYAHETVFLQAVQEVLSTLQPALDKDAKYEKNKILERIVEPERIIAFRVEWVDDKGEIQVNRALSRSSRTPSPVWPSAAPRAAPTSTPRASPKTK